MKILNLYAGIGGNRKLWGDKHEIVSVECDPDIAAIYKDLFPNDTVIVGKYEKNQIRLDVLQYQEICSILGIDSAEGLELIKDRRN